MLDLWPGQGRADYQCARPQALLFLAFMTNSTMRVHIVGLGSWGRTLLKTFATVAGLQVVGATDRNPENRIVAQGIAPNLIIDASFNPKSIAKSAELAVVCVQAEHHFEIGKALIDAGMNVFFEKPFTPSLKLADVLVARAERAHVQIHIDHPYLYSTSYQAFKATFKQAIDGKVQSFRSDRLDYGSFPLGVGVFEHLIYHDLYLLDDLVGLNTLREIKRQAYTQPLRSVPDVGELWLEGQGPAKYQISGSMLNPTKVRSISVQSLSHNLIWEDQASEPRIELLNLAAPQASQAIAVRSGPTPLQLQFQSILTKGLDSASVEQSLRVKRFLETGRVVAS